MNVDWTQFKSLKSNKGLNIQMFETDNMYNLAMFENSLAVSTNIAKTDPKNPDQVDFEDNYKSDVNQEVISKSKDLIDKEGTQGALSVGTSAVEVKVEATPLEDRKSITIYNNSENVVYWGYNNSVTVTTGTPIDESEFAVFKISDSASIYLVADTSGNDIRITEAK